MGKAEEELALPENNPKAHIAWVKNREGDSRPERSDSLIAGSSGRHKLE